MSISEMLTFIMTKRRINQDQLANLLEVDKSQITRWLNGAKPKQNNTMAIYMLYTEVKNEEK